MSIDEGYVKYRSDWSLGPPPSPACTELLNVWRKPLYDAGLIGQYADLGIGFGNISVRAEQPGQFVISGTQTGHLAVTSGEHYALVTRYNIKDNQVCCTGPVLASSESLTHAAIYALDSTINAVVHVHSKPLWLELLNNVPTTRDDVAYGTPEMANEFARLYRESDFAARGIAVMAGHEEGIISIGASLQQAAQRILNINR